MIRDQRSEIKDHFTIQQYCPCPPRSQGVDKPGYETGPPLPPVVPKPYDAKPPPYGIKAAAPPSSGGGYEPVAAVKAAPIETYPGKRACGYPRAERAQMRDNVYVLLFAAHQKQRQPPAQAPPEGVHRPTPQAANPYRKLVS